MTTKNGKKGYRYKTHVVLDNIVAYAPIPACIRKEARLRRGTKIEVRLRKLNKETRK